MRLGSSIRNYVPAFTVYVQSKPQKGVTRETCYYVAIFLAVYRLFSAAACGRCICHIRQYSIYQKGMDEQKPLPL